MFVYHLHLLPMSTTADTSHQMKLMVMHVFRFIRFTVPHVVRPLPLPSMVDYLTFCGRNVEAPEEVDLAPTEEDAFLEALLAKTDAPLKPLKEPVAPAPQRVSPGHVLWKRSDGRISCREWSLSFAFYSHSYFFLRFVVRPPKDFRPSF